MPNVYFPNLNLSFHLDSVAFELFGIQIYWYGIIITIGVILGTLVASYLAEKEGLEKDIVTDFLLYDLIIAIIGARAYYVIFNWEVYKDNWLSIFNIREGGIAIYGAVITSVLVAIIYTRKKKIPLFQFADIAVYGLLIGQIIGRYGNFVNKEAYGDYTNGLFAMQILKSDARPSFSENILNHTVFIQGQEFIQVHPTFFYESCWNIFALIVLILFRKHRKNYGEIFCLYWIIYGIGRFWIEGLRTDQLLIGNTGIAISQVVAITTLLGGIGVFIALRKKDFKKM